MIAIVDYGVGNLFSLCSSLTYIGQEAVITGDAAVIESSDKVILPGVGAFADAASKLRASGLDEVVKREAARGKPLLGVCLGMQLLFDKSFEFGEHAGLGLLRGEVVTIAPASVPPLTDSSRSVTSAEALSSVNSNLSTLKIPHIGWNALIFKKQNEGTVSPLFRYISEGDYVYFVHSFHAVRCEESLIASAEYGSMLTAAVAQDNVFGTQFHPEKSGEVGLNILRAFAEG